MTGVPPRRGPAVATGAAVAVVACAHTLLRGTAWAYEWVWASFQYQLVVVLVAPLLAGAAAWEAVAFRHVSGAVRSAGRSTSFAGLVVVRLMAWAGVGLAVGALPVLWAVWAVRGVEAPPLAALLLVVPAAAQLAAVAGTSYVLAAAWPRPAVVPLLSAAWFGGLIAANVVLPEQVARVGGASASLIGLHVPPATTLLQVAVPLALATAAGAAVWAASVAGTPVGPRIVVATGPVLVAVLLVASQPTGQPLFERRPVTTTCVGQQPSWCVAGPYVAAVGVLRTRTEPAFEEVDAVGAPRPDRIVQGRAGRTTVEEVLHGDPALRAVAVVYAWLHGGCTVRASSPLLDDLSRWVAYLEDRLDGRRPRADGAEAASLRAAADRIVACDRR